jgi:hypothetical protein
LALSVPQFAAVWKKKYRASGEAIAHARKRSSSSWATGAWMPRIECSNEQSNEQYAALIRFPFSETPCGKSRCG